MQTRPPPSPAPADAAMRRLLRVPDGGGSGPADDVHGVFSKSILISATRCLLTYVILPFVAPFVGLAAGVGATIGLPLGLAGIVANVVSIRRFWKANHRWRWPATLVSASVIVLLVILVVEDVAELLG